MTELTRNAKYPCLVVVVTSALEREGKGKFRHHLVAKNCDEARLCSGNLGEQKCYLSVTWIRVG